MVELERDEPATRGVVAVYDDQTVPRERFKIVLVFAANPVGLLPLRRALLFVGYMLVHQLIFSQASEGCKGI